MRGFVLVDVEAFGLDPVRDPLLEVGFGIYDDNLNLIESMSTLIWDKRTYGTHLARLRDENDFVYQMHQGSGLLDDVRRRGVEISEAEKQVHLFLREFGVNDGLDPLVGSSVHYDRSMLKAQMPSVEARFHYRNIDTSSVKELCRRFNPDLYARLDTEVVPQKRHRVLDDIQDTVDELKWYRNNFMVV